MRGTRKRPQFSIERFMIVVAVLAVFFASFSGWDAAQRTRRAASLRRAPTQFREVADKFRREDDSQAAPWGSTARVFEAAARNP